MIRNFWQAREAFVWGVPYAALALMRSIAEVVLRDFYGASGSNLAELISNVSDLPEGVHPAALNRLREMANTVLHLDH